MKAAAKVAWGYISEVILALILTALLCAAYGLSPSLALIKNIASDVAAYVFSILLAAALALIWTIFSKADSQFYTWLTSKGALDVYLKAMCYVAIVELFAVIFSIISKFTTSNALLLLATPIMFLGFINGITMIKNIFDLIKLNIAFEKNKKNIPPS